MAARGKLLFFFLLLALSFLVGDIFVEGAIKVTNPTQSWQAAFNSLVAGDTLYLEPGTYSYSGNWNLNLTGTATAPITMTGYTNSTRPIFAIQGNYNIINIQQGNYLIFDYLEFNGIGGVDTSTLGVRLGTPTSVVSNSIFRNLLIHDTGTTAFSANFANGLTYTNLTIVHNEVHSTGTGTGECFYLGCSGDGCRISNSIIANNYCHNTTLATGGSHGSGIQVKPGSYNNIIQDNVCHQLGSPCVLVYDDYDRGRNQIIGNLLVSGKDNGIQATAGVDIINNIIITPAFYGISLQNNVDLAPGKVYRNVTIRQNTIVNATEGCLYLSGISSTTNWNVANNALYCPGAPAVKVSPYNGSPSNLSPGLLYNNVVLTGTTIVSGAQPGAYLNSTGEFKDMISPALGNLNLYPTSSGALPNAGNPSYSYSVDYNGTPRSTTTPTVGAYEYTTPSNPGIALNPTNFKTNSTNYVPPTPTTGGGSTGVTGGGSGGSSSSSPAGGLRNFKAEWLHKLRTEYNIYV